MKHIIQDNLSTNYYLDIPISNTQFVIPEGNADFVTNLNDLVERESNNSFKYKFIFDLDVLATNVLVSWNEGSVSWQNVLDAAIYDEEDDDYDTPPLDLIKELNGWYYLQNGCTKSFLEPTQIRFETLNVFNRRNWDIFLAYPYENDVVDLTFDGILLSEGLGIYDMEIITIGQKTMALFTTNLKHNLQEGDTVFFEADNVNVLNGEQTIFSIGNVEGLNKDNQFIVDKTIQPFNFLTQRLRFKRIVDGYTSSYHGRWYRRITPNEDVDVYNTSFALNIFGEQHNTLHFKQPIDRTDYIDSFGKPVLELAVFFVKRQDNTLTNPSFWTDLSSGVRGAVSGASHDVTHLHANSPIMPIEMDVRGQEVIFGDIVERNELDFRTTVLQTAYHRFNMQSRENVGFLEGYMYQALQYIELNVYDESPITSLDFEDVPEYASVLDNNRVVYRDILPNYIYSELTNLPYINGLHRVYQNLKLSVSRQDPCRLLDYGNEPIIKGKCGEDILNDATAQTDYC